MYCRTVPEAECSLGWEICCAGSPLLLFLVCHVSGWGRRVSGPTGENGIHAGSLLLGGWGLLICSPACSAKFPYVVTRNPFWSGEEMNLPGISSVVGWDWEMLDGLILLCEGLWGGWVIWHCLVPPVLGSEQSALLFLPVRIPLWRSLVLFPGFAVVLCEKELG